ncbi:MULTISPECIES: ogr/Delta-like zinc finger family protein [Pseudomonas]|uniref:Ogr/Delta-like zinc finger n=1 Tax=Pseudomonas lutea TaxID=243924 RepID=A0A9X8MHR4_9PSED|nr:MULTISPECIES: ogr/Delta-like zinc finger family protein [Pseudomonas]SER49141.1 Ogr/Delta-like zinc finger [Pseudomonas lutea]
MNELEVQPDLQSKRSEDFYSASVLANARQRECPDCGGPLVRRNSVRQSAILREISFKCENFLCGATFKGYEEIVYRLRVPDPCNPLVKLPVCPSRKHATPKHTGKPVKGACPECGDKIRQILVPTDNPYTYVLYLHCSRNECSWSAEGQASLEYKSKKELLVVSEPVTSPAT